MQIILPLKGGNFSNGWLEEDQLALQKDLNLLENWGNTWGVRFNAAKCNIMRVSRTHDPKLFNYSLLLLSCHQTAFFHLSTHFLAFSLNFWRSSKVQECASNGHCNICLVVSGAWPHSHVVSPLKYFHLLRCSLLHATPVRNLLRHLHAAQGLVCLFAKLSSRLFLFKENGNLHIEQEKLVLTCFFVSS